MYYIVGSGPAGVACARALAEAGCEVTILDPGISLEPDRRRAVEALSKRSSGGWNSDEVAFLRKGIASSRSGIPLKLAYGSDYPYREPPGATPVICEGVDSKPSYAVGGLSSVWGSSMLPQKAEDIHDWPIALKDLEDGYRAVLRWVPISAQQDSLSSLFPLYSEGAGTLPASNQARSLIADLDRSRQALNARGLFHGHARLAVQADSCVRCGVCMYGCPHGLIWSSEPALREMIDSGRVHYRPGVTVRRVKEKSGGVQIDAIGSAGEPLSIEGERVFLAAGVLGTTAILLRSMELYGTSIPIRDSQYFLLPMLRLQATRGVVREPLHTLAQLFLEVFDKSISAFTVHLQTYTYNELFRDAIQAALGPLRRVFPMEAFLGRMLLLQGYFHSDESPGISATLEKDGESDRLRLRAVPNPETRKRVRRLASKLAGLSRHTRSLPLLPLLQMGLPGRGFHSGGSFPMRATPSERESDILGRPAGLKRVHAVDSTVLPSITATTITLTVMANAWRIGQLVGCGEADL